MWEVSSTHAFLSVYDCADGAGELATQGHLRKVFYGESREFLGAKRIMVIGKVNKDE